MYEGQTNFMKVEKKMIQSAICDAKGIDPVLS